ncbi:transglutaminase domain-containing protein, partial [Brachybacterium conglomeratum]
PPHRAVEQLLDRIAEGTPEVTAEDRAAAARLADAYTAAAYAAPLPAAARTTGHDGARATPAGTAARDDAETAPAEERLQHPLRHDADRIVGLIRTAR